MFRCPLGHANPADWVGLDARGVPLCPVCRNYVTDPRYTAFYDGRPVPPRPATTGPGTELKALLASVGLAAGGCSCNARAAEMDRWGVDGCRERKAEIVAWLREERERRGWGESLRAGLRAVATGLAFRLDPTDILGSLVEEAIRRAETQAPG